MTYSDWTKVGLLYVKYALLVKRPFTPYHAFDILILSLRFYLIIKIDKIEAAFRLLLDRKPSLES